MRRWLTTTIEIPLWVYAIMVGIVGSWFVLVLDKIGAF